MTDLELNLTMLGEKSALPFCGLSESLGAFCRRVAPHMPPISIPLALWGS